MLELINISKTYKPKKGAPVRALKSVTLSFDDRGMVFVLGKSGCGKSTLLNLIGGLDIADSGEIIIEGKSTGSFKESDYDRYRNEYIGFVFQEYNLLEDMTVGENISLAMELQGNTSDKGRLEEILEQVGLKGYAQRKTNELSGGQKQRVAIARAMVKNPKIIMADEPTGALDSATGKAILDTLKELSESRLVIVVSHDREFAEQYGDRIIELEDGEVIKDENRGERNKGIKEREKTEKSERTFKSAGLPYRRALAMGAKTMRKKRLRLAITILLCFLSFTAFGAVDVMAHFDRNYASQTALKFNEDCISINGSILGYEYTKWNRKSGIESSCADLQKIREMTGLDFQGVLGNTMTGLRLWNKELLNDDGKNYYTGALSGILPATQDFFRSQGYELIGRMPENDSEIVITKYIFDQYARAGFYMQDGHIPPEQIDGIQDFLNKKPTIDYKRFGASEYEYVSIPELTIVGVVDTKADPDGRIKNMDLKGVDYNYAARNYFEKGYHSLFYVTQSLYDYVLHSLPQPDGTGFGRTVPVRIGDFSFQGAATSQALNKTQKIVWLDGKGDRRELAENEIVIGYSEAGKLWPCLGERVEKSMSCRYSKSHINDTVRFSKIDLYAFRKGGAACVAYCEEAENITSEELEIYKQYCLENKYIFKDLGSLRTSDLLGHDYSFSYFNHEAMSEDDWRFSYACYLSTIHKAGGHYNGGIGYEFDVDGGYNHNVTGRKSGEEIDEENSNRIFVDNRLENAMASAKKTFAEDYTVSYSNVSRDLSYDVSFDGDPIVVGIYVPEDGYPDNFVINDTLYEKSFDYEDMTYTYLVAPITDDEDVLRKIVELNYSADSRRGFVCNNVSFVAVNFLANPFSVLTPFLKWAGAILAGFSILLLGNYISISISAKKKEIGILRALGASKRDIFAIFINECVIITAIILILAITSVLIVCVGFNTELPNSFGIQIKALNFGIRQLVLLLGLGVGATFISSAIPLYMLSRKKPIDCISDR